MTIDIIAVSPFPRAKQTPLRRIFVFIICTDGNQRIRPSDSRPLLQSAQYDAAIRRHFCREFSPSSARSWFHFRIKFAHNAPDSAILIQPKGKAVQQRRIIPLQLAAPRQHIPHGHQATADAPPIRCSGGCPSPISRMNTVSIRDAMHISDISCAKHRFQIKQCILRHLHARKQAEYVPAQSAPAESACRT